MGYEPEPHPAKQRLWPAEIEAAGWELLEEFPNVAVFLQHRPTEQLMITFADGDETYTDNADDIEQITRMLAEHRVQANAFPGNPWNFGNPESRRGSSMMRPGSNMASKGNLPTADNLEIDAHSNSIHAERLLWDYKTHPDKAPWDNDWSTVDSNQMAQTFISGTPRSEFGAWQHWPVNGDTEGEKWDAWYVRTAQSDWKLHTDILKEDHIYQQHDAQEAAARHFEEAFEVHRITTADVMKAGKSDPLWKLLGLDVLAIEDLLKTDPRWNNLDSLGTNITLIVGRNALDEIDRINNQVRQNRTGVYDVEPPNINPASLIRGKSSLSRSDKKYDYRWKGRGYLKKKALRTQIMPAHSKHRSIEQLVWDRWEMPYQGFPKDRTPQQWRRPAMSKATATLVARTLRINSKTPTLARVVPVKGGYAVYERPKSRKWKTAMMLKRTYSPPNASGNLHIGRNG